MLRLLALVSLLALSTGMGVAAPLGVPDATARIGETVLTADGVPVGRLMAVRAGPGDSAICIVELSPELRARTSPLVVDGLHPGADGLRLRATFALLTEQRIVVRR
jgi:hypothetical protein